MSETVPKEWQKKKLGRFGKFSTSSVDKKINPNEQSVYLLNYMDIYRNSILDESHPFQSVTAPQKQISSSNVVSGDVFFTPSSETPDDIGHSGVFIGDIKNLVHSYHTIRYRTHSPDVLDDRFKAYAFKSNNTYAYFRKTATGSTRFTISLPVFEELEVLIPPLPEQKKIASILASVDEVIENTQKQIDKLQDLKKATMNELLTKGLGHTEFKDSELGRIPKNWGVKKLEEVGQIIGGGTPASENENYWGGEIQWVTPKEITKLNDRYIEETERTLTKKGLEESSAKLHPKGTILLTSRASIGFPAINTVPMATNQGFQSLRPNKRLDTEFGYQILLHSRQKLERLSAGSTFLEISSKEVKKFKLSIPPLPEQKKIASILTSMDKNIKDKQQKLHQNQSPQKIPHARPVNGQGKGAGELMSSDEFGKVELPALEQLQSLGWSYVEGSKLSPEESDERGSFKDVVLENRLTDSIQRINPWISEENLRKIVRDLTKTPYPNLVEANQSIWNTINQCVSVIQDLGKGNKGQTIHIIDFDNLENNEFLCINQFKVEGINQHIIPDIVLFVNGLPLAVVECKSPYITNPMEAGIDQLLRYANRRNPSHDEGAERLFHYNQMMISTHRDKARVGTITSYMEHFLEWKDPYPLTMEQVRTRTKLSRDTYRGIVY